jgi:outer membrane protein assembly factor BamE (lipoprotein component of BamABCDE complex)
VRIAKLKFPLLSCALLSLSGCAIFADEPHYRGVAVSEHDLKELTPGLSQQADVQAVLGPPTFVEQFDQNNWDYVSQLTRMRIAQTEGVQRQHVVVVTFDNNGVLQSITQKDKADAVHVAMDSKQTPVPGGHAGFLRMLVGGVGSYNPLGAASDTSANSAVGAAPTTIGSGSSGSSSGF